LQNNNEELIKGRIVNDRAKYKYVRILSTMIKKKICMLGAFAVGKTSLVQRYVNSIFSKKYHTTIGVKIDQKKILFEDNEVNLILWDIHGEDDFLKVKPAYLIGSSGFFLVVDGTRKYTLDIALSLRELAQKSAGKVPFFILINKSDLNEDWEIKENDLLKLKEAGIKIILTSAKEGTGVEEAFTQLTQMMLSKET